MLINSHDPNSEANKEIHCTKQYKLVSLKNVRKIIIIINNNNALIVTIYSIVFFFFFCLAFIDAAKLVGT